MNTDTQTPDAVTGELTGTLWITLYLLLLPLAKRWVYASNTFSWVGQENDVAWDIVLMTIQRTYEYTLKAQRENIPIASLQREIDIAEAVLDKVHEECLFQEIAKEIATYPPKMRLAMLIDIARRMDFDSKPTPLQAAFLALRIQLQDFQDLLPEDPVMRSRHASLVSLGYRKLAMLLRNRGSCAMVMKIAHDRVWKFRTSISYP